MNNASAVVAWAKSQVGVKETGTNITPYAADIDKNYPDFYNGKKQGVAWCDIFVDYAFIKCFGESEALKLLCQPKKSAGAGCKFSYGYFKKKKQVGKEARIGAQIFFSNDGTENGINHTGIVVDFDSSKVYTVEGNSNNQVAKHSYSHADKKIYGYGYPKYDVETVEIPEPIKADITSVARDVIAGKFGNGSARKKALESAGYNYEEVQTKVNELLNVKKPTTTFTMKVNVSEGSSLNVRATPNGRIVGGLGRDDEVTVLSYVANGWTKISFNGSECYVFSIYLK